MLLLVGALCSACHGEPRSEPWEVVVGADRVTRFETDFLPYSNFYFAYAAPDDPATVLVATGDNRGLIRPQGRWGPPKRPLDAYVFVLDGRIGTVGLMPFAEFAALATVAEQFEQPLQRDYPALSTGGTVVERPGMVSLRGGEPALLGAVSFDVDEDESTTFGLPSLLPFMGRQEFFEKDTFLDGTVYLDLFEQGQPDAPRVRLSKRIEDFKSYPDFDDLASWVQGSPTPRLVLIDSRFRGNRRQDALILVEP